MTFQLLTAGDVGDTPQSTAEPSAAATSGDANADQPPEVAKYFQKPKPGTPAWVFPLLATMLTVIVGGGFLGYRLYKKAHYL